MTNTDCKILKRLLGNGPAAEKLRKQLQSAKSNSSLMSIYHAAIPIIEQHLWADGIDEAELQDYQQLFQEMAKLISPAESDARHNFVIIIPVADRPQHLRTCLESLWELCQRYPYDNNKIALLIAEDSQAPENRRQHKDIVTQFQQRGLPADYFGLDEQIALLNKMSVTDAFALSGIIGEIKTDAFYHKGASVTRNIAYLKLNDRTRDNTLFFFIDSDQEFNVQVSTGAGGKTLYAINYFYHLDRIFSNTDIQILTGKVVGDPPVSPAVMANNFLNDIITFLERMAAVAPEQCCSFHGNNRNKPNGAAYHDMANLFGFTQAVDTIDYLCPLTGPHNHADCFNDFSQKLNHFFDGEHPTRKTSFEYEDLTHSIKPARTIYSGNYIFKAEALRYFIPYAGLKLRMAGPVLGRIIKAEIGDQFVSANLPMLHKRTIEKTGQSEFRPDIHRRGNNIDLSGEFERQFFGDVMLFSMEKLTAKGYPNNLLSEKIVAQVLHDTERNLLDQYHDKHTQINDTLINLKSQLFTSLAWWQHKEFASALGQFKQFVTNIETNFGDDSRAFNLLNSSEHRRERRQQILAAILAYTKDRRAWEDVLYNRQ